MLFQKILHNKNRQNFIIFLAKSYGITALSLIQVFILLKYLSVELFGQMQFILSLIPILGIFTLHGADTAMIQLTANRKEYYFKTILRYRASCSVIASIIILATQAYYYDTLSINLHVTLLIIAVFFPLSPIKMFASVLNGSKQISLLAKYEIIIKTLVILIVCGAALQTDPNLSLLVLPSFLIPIVIYAFLAIRYDFGPQEIKPENLKKELSYVLKRSLTSLIPIIENKADKIVIGLIYGFTDLGIFSVAKFAQEQLKTVLSTITNIILPLLTTCPKSELKMRAKKYTFFALLCTSLSAVVIAFGAEWLINTFLFEKYGESVQYLKLLVFGTLFAVPGTVKLFEKVATKNVKEEAYLRSTISMLYLLSLPFFLHIYGIFGVIYAVIFKCSCLTIIPYASDWFSRSNPNVQANNQNAN